jgi:hypothetical protein
MPATGIVTQKIGEFEYRVASDDGIDAEFTGTSISKEPLSKGERVRIINVVSGRDGVPEYGFCRENFGLRGVVGIPDGQKEGFANNSPCNYIAAYVAYHAGKITQLYDIAKVIASTGSRLNVVMLTGDVPYLETTLNCSGIWPGSFAPGDIALVRRGSRNLIVGWWYGEISGLIVLSYKYSYHFGGSRFKEYSINPDSTGIEIAESIFDGKKYIYAPIARDTASSGDKKVCVKYNITTHAIEDVHAEEMVSGLLITTGGARVGSKIVLTPGWEHVSMPGGGADKYATISGGVFAWSTSISNRRYGLKHVVSGSKIYSAAGDKLVSYDADTEAVTDLCTIPSATLPLPYVDVVPWFYVLVKTDLNKIIMLPRDIGYLRFGIYDIDSAAYSESGLIPSLATGATSGAVFGEKVYFFGQDGVALRCFDASSASLSTIKTFSVFYYKVHKINEKEMLLYGEKMSIYNIETGVTEDFIDLNSDFYLSAWAVLTE